jgi:CheY-like chemotaxis protein
VDVVDNGQLAVDHLTLHPKRYSAVLMDIQMPVMDGYAATHTIRNALGLDQLPIIAMTANAMASDRTDCLAAESTPLSLDPTSKPQPAKAAAPDDTLPELGCTDVPAALARLDGDAGLYVQILQTYVQDVATLPDQLDNATQR